MKFTISTQNTHTMNSNMIAPPTGGVCPEESGLMKKAKLAERMSVSLRTIDKWVANRIIPYIQISPGFNRFEYEAVIAVIRKRYGVNPVDRD